MKNLLSILIVVVCAFLIETCAVSFSGRQSISYTVSAPFLSNNKKQTFESAVTDDPKEIEYNLESYE